ncbi:MAG: two-component hybrid sensor and regulator [Labilithrix sp.]|nr:two-component hybrid sensor and regulator [Labilithrix sp.]
MIETSPVAPQIYRPDGTVVLVSKCSGARLRTRRPELHALVDGAHGGLSAPQAVLAGHGHAVPFGSTYLAPGEAGVERSEHGVPTHEPAVLDTQLGFIVDGVPQLIWSTLPDGYHDYFNERWYDYTGVPFEQAKGTGWFDYLHPDDRRRTWQAWQHSLMSGEPYQSEFRFRRHDGEFRWFLARALPARDSSGRVVRWFGGTTDIDDRKRGECQREVRLAELERATLLKDEFLASTSHELRTPLNAILGWASMQRIHPELSPHAMEVIERNAQAMSELINDLLDMSRIVANKLAIEREPLDVAPLVYSVVDIVRPAMEAKRLSLRLAIDERVGVVLADPNRLRQVISNLLSNAVKFTLPGGVVTIVAERRGSKVVVEVTDTGHGISPDFLPYVFDRFRQADGSNRRRKGGLGLGLSIARCIVEFHGGELRAHSEGIGHGATFTMTLPSAALAITSGHGTAADHATALRLDGVHALIVDDDPDARELVTTVLRGAGATTDDVDSASSALAAIRARLPDIVLSDIGMPERSGYDLVAELRSRGFDRPVVALTACASSEDRARALRSGFDDHIAKPVEPDVLVRASAQLVGSACGRLHHP